MPIPSKVTVMQSKTMTTGVATTSTIVALDQSFARCSNPAMLPSNRSMLANVRLSCKCKLSRTSSTALGITAPGKSIVAGTFLQRRSLVATESTAEAAVRQLTVDILATVSFGRTS
ncbi:hypothetical protein MRX96_059048 [Rhipicephalus microplus]